MNNVSTATNMEAFVPSNDTASLMAGLVFVPLYFADWDRRVKGLSPVQKGILSDLFIFACQKNEPVRDKKHAYRIASLSTRKEKRVCDEILDLFFVKTDVGFVNFDAQKLVNEQLEKMARRSQGTLKGHMSRKTNQNGIQPITETETDLSEDHDRQLTLVRSKAKNIKTKQTRERAKRTSSGSVSFQKSSSSVAYATPKSEESNLTAVVPVDTFVENGHFIAISSGNLAMTDMTWVKPYLRLEMAGLRQEKPELDEAHALDLWKNVCLSAAKNGAKYPRWYQKGFEADCKKFLKGKKAGGESVNYPQQRVWEDPPAPEVVIPEVIQAWKNGQPIRHIATGSVYQPAEIELFFQEGEINVAFRQLKVIGLSCGTHFKPVGTYKHLPLIEFEVCSCEE